MPVVFAAKLSFEDYIINFATVNHRNGNPWTTDEIIIETGEDKEIVKAYATYLEHHPGLTREQYLALSPVLVQSPMGFVMNERKEQQSISNTLQSKVGDVTVAEFIAALKSQ